MVCKKILTIITLSLVSGFCQAEENHEHHSWHTEHKERKAIHDRNVKQKEDELKALNEGECKDRLRDEECEHKRNAIREKSIARESKEKADLANKHNNTWRKRHKNRKADHAEKRAEEEMKKAKKAKKDKKKSKKDN